MIVDGGEKGEMTLGDEINTHLASLAKILGSFIIDPGAPKSSAPQR